MAPRKRNKTQDPMKTYKTYKENINILLNKIQKDEYKKGDIPIIIILFFSKKDFRTLNQADIIKYISNPKLFPSLANLMNLEDEIMLEFKKNKLFEINKKEVTIVYDKCLEYLTSYSEKNTSTNSSHSNKDKKADVLNSSFSKIENDNASSHNKLNMNFVIDGHNCLNKYFRLREKSQIKLSKKKIPNFNNLPPVDEKDKKNVVDKEGLTDKIMEKYDPQYEMIFGENKYFQNIRKVASEFFNFFKKANNDKTMSQKADEIIKKLYKLFNEINTKIESINKLSASFNEIKRELINCNSIIKRHLELMKLICSDDVFTNDIYNGEKEIYFFYQKAFQKMIDNLKDFYDELKKTENTIINYTLLLKNELNNISDEFKLPENSHFLKLIKDVNDTESIIININLPEALKLFNFFLDENKKLFEKIEENSKKKWQEK